MKLVSPLSPRAVVAWHRLLLVCVPWLHAEIILPGTQPNEGGIEFTRIDNCMMCHSGTPNGNADPYLSWQGSMMAQSARDPVFRAALAIANQDIPGSGEFCIRCHAPRGWLAGRSTVADGSLLNRQDLHGVSCDVCHHLVDPLSDEAKKLAKKTPPGYGNAMLVADPENVSRGPYPPNKEVKPHQMLKSPYHASSELCANCHNVSNPFQAQDVNTQPPHAYGHIERTYSEWALSDFAKPQSLQTCQSCHFARVPEGGQASKYAKLHRDHFVSHNAVGGSTWIQDAIWKIWKGKDLDLEALQLGQKHAREFLKTAAALNLEFVTGKGRLTITNLTGHKLPSGYPEGRRMWINVRFLDESGKVISELGQYGEREDVVAGSKVRAPTLLDAGATRVYECVPGISAAQARKFNKSPGPSFHFVLNDVTTKDNRIPPRGYQKSRFAEHLCAPTEGGYVDGQYWDQFEFSLPSGTDQVEVRLMYQSVSWEYMKFLREENKSDTWGAVLYEAWKQTGQCPPEAIAAITRRVKL